MLGLGSVRRRSAVFAVFAVAVVTVVSGVAPVSPAGAQGAPPAQVLERDMRGEQAIQALGDRLGEVAALNDMTPTEFRDALLADSMLWVDRTGRLLFVDEFVAPDEAPIDHGSLDGATVPSETEIFGLHSRPGAQRVIVLDFNGHDARGTAWGNTAAQDTAPFNFEGDGATFSAAERAVIFSVWQRVAEDYAPFDVDVTTQDPGHGQNSTGHPIIRRDDTNDIQYGTRVVVTPSKPYNCSCGGVAYVGVYDATGTTHDYYQPAWVFTAGVGTGAKNIAEAASHEAGHNLGLSHDGTRRSGYYTGHGDWAPIMGVGYYEPITQWSRGEYSGASNKEDDFAVAQANGAPLAADDWPGTTPLGSALSGVIGTRTDVDSFSFSLSLGGRVQLTASPATVSPDLDIELSILNGSGATVARHDPPSDASSGSDTGAGLGADIDTTLPAGAYTVQVSGVGWGDPLSTGYSDYGSVGRYNLTLSLSDDGSVGDPVDQPPVASATASVTNGSLTVGFTGSAVDDGDITSWAWAFGDGTGSEVQNPTHTYAAAGTYTATLTVTDDAGQSDSATVVVTVKASKPGNGGGKPSKGGNRAP